MAGITSILFFSNDGSATVELPNITDSQVRFKVKAVGSIWLDISNSNSSIIFQAGVDGCTDEEALIQRQTLTTGVANILSDLIVMEMITV